MKTPTIALIALVIAACGQQAPPPTAMPSFAEPSSVQPSSAQPSGAPSAPASIAKSSPTPALAWDIPWADLPQPAPYDPKPLPTTPPPASAPACTAEQLVGRNLGYPGITQDDGDVIDLRNVSDRTCLLTGTVHATLFGTGAAPLQVTGTGRYFPDTMASFDMPPGQSTQVWFFATYGCERRPADGSKPIPVTSASIEIPGGGTVTVTGLDMPRECGITAKQFSQNLPARTYPPTPLDGATFSLEAPATVHAGQSFDFVVSVVNPTSSPITMTPCPAYNEWLSVGTPDTKGIYGLNCMGHTSLAVHERLRFQMRLTVPEDAPSGPAELRWGPAALIHFGHVPVVVIGNDSPCHAADLTASAPETARAFAQTGFYDVKDAGSDLSVTLTNTSNHLCTLQGTPTVGVTDAGGRPLQLEQPTGQGWGQPTLPPAQIRIGPGDSARTTLSWHTRWCATDPNPVTVELGLPTEGGTVTVRPAQGWTPPRCGGFDWHTVTATQFGR